jgi:hypothetical protein
MKQLSCRRCLPAVALKAIIIQLLLATAATTSSLGQDTLPKTLPRSSNTIRETPWTPSFKIDNQGFLDSFYHRMPGDWEKEVRLHTLVTTHEPVQIRQVPGDGNCLFHSISLALYHAVNGSHWRQNPNDDLYAQSRHLRHQAVACLRHNQRRLYIQGRETVRARDLVEAAAHQYKMSASDYCQTMQQDCVWGGGPEIVALCNVLQRPIHVYELATCQNNQFLLRRMACFGSPKFDQRKALHLLSADSRFPDLEPGQQMSSGNHFLAVFPMLVKKRIRGGGAWDCIGDDYATFSENVDSAQTTGKSRWRRWLRRLSFGIWSDE